MSDIVDEARQWVARWEGSGLYDPTLGNAAPRLVAGLLAEIERLQNCIEMDLGTCKANVLAGDLARVSRDRDRLRAHLTLETERVEAAERERDEVMSSFWAQRVLNERDEARAELASWQRIAEERYQTLCGLQEVEQRAAWATETSKAALVEWDIAKAGERGATIAFEQARAALVELVRLETHMSWCDDNLDESSEEDQETVRGAWAEARRIVGEKGGA